MATSINGTTGNDSLLGTSGDDSITGLAGNDTIDGGAGINTYIIEGNADAFTRRVVYDSATGVTSWQITDLVVGGQDALNASDQGVDSLRNIQKLRFVLPDGSLDSEVVIDDFANSVDATNQEIEYGSWINGRINFYSDTDWLRISEVAGQKYVVFFGEHRSVISFNGNFVSLYSWDTRQLVQSPTTTQVSDLQISSVYLSSSTPNNSLSYSFVLRRQLDGGVGNDSLQAGTGYEYLVGGAGNDTLTGSARSDYLAGGDGNDLMTGGAGSDELDGGGGIANVAVFSNTRAQYSFQWLGSSDLGLKVSALNGGADGIDTLRNVQILRFADGDVVLDTQGSDPFGLSPNNIGQALLGSLPGTGNSTMWVDQDAFAQKFSGLTTDSTLRIKATSWGNSGNIDFNFKLIGTQDALVFSDANTPSQTYSSFEAGSGTRTWFVKPQYWGSGQQAFAGDRADVVVSGYAYGDFGSFLNYNITVDRVQLGTTGADTMTADGLSTYMDAQAGNDSVTGGALGEEIQGGLGDDTLGGGAGADTLVGGGGRNSISGGDGDDVIDVSSSSTATDTIDGGAGTDTLKVASDTSWTGLSVTGMEVLDGSGGRTAQTPAELLIKGFTTAQNITFRLHPSLASGGTLDASGLAGSFNLRGSNQSDTLIGNANNNTIYLNSDETLGAGYPVDSVQGGAGDDTIVWSTNPYQQWSKFFSNADSSSKTYKIKGDLNGGAGSDLLALDFGNNYWYHPWGNTWDQANSSPWKLDLTELSLGSIERLDVSGYDANRFWAYPSEFILTTSQLAALGATSGLRAVSIVGGGALDLAHLADLRISTWRIGDALAYQVSGTVNGDSLTIGAGAFTADLGDGDDEFIVDSKALVADTLAGGAGMDTLTIRGSDVDLSGAVLSGMEAIKVSAQSLSMTEAQWTSLGATLTRVAGASTSYILSIMTPGTTSMAADSPYVGLTGSSGDDQLIGNAENNILVGGDGSDTLTGNAGNDRLVSGAGLDSLLGGAGDDTLVVTGKSTSRDEYNGAGGIDTLQITASVDLTAATLSGLEVLSGSGTVTLSAAQLAGFAEVRGVAVQLSGSSNEFNLGATSLGAGVSVLMPAVDPTLAISAGVFGSKGDDSVTAGAGADVIYGGRGADRLDGAGGNDTLVGGSGSDTLVGGAGDDLFRVEASELSTSATTHYSDLMDGGAGSDTLELNFSQSGRFEISAGAVSNMEGLVVRNPGNVWQPVLALSASNWNALTSFLSSNGSAHPYYGTNLAISGAGENISFSAVDAASSIGVINLLGTYYAIDASHVTIGQTADISYDNARNHHHISVSSFDSIVLSGGSDLLVVNSDTGFNVTAGAGDDTVKANVSGKLVASIDGGAGNDTLDLSGSGFVDLTQSTLTSIESVKYGTSTLVLTEAQLAGLSLDGSGPKYTKVGSAIVGTSGADSYMGDGSASSSFQGGGGNDTVMDVNTAVFTGNYADYDFVRNGGSLAVQQARGSLADGTDTLVHVMNAKFADTTMVIDDAPDSLYGRYVFADLTHADYDKRVSARRDYGADTDLFSATLVPNSPLTIVGSTEKGSDWYIEFKDVATGRNLEFKSMVYGGNAYRYANWMSASDKWLPGFSTSDGFKPYQGGDVVLQYNLSGTDIQNYAFTLSYLDDYAGSVDTLGTMDALLGELRGYIGDFNDADWIRTSLIAGTKYEFNLKGLGSGGGTLIDPKLQLLDGQGNLIETGFDLEANRVGGDDRITFRPTTSSSYYLAVTDVGGIAKGSWTLTQASLDTIAGNTSSTARAEWSAAQQFSISSEINSLSDHDWFRVWLDRGLTYSFRDLGASGGGGTLANPQLSLRSVTGFLQAQDDNSGGGSDARLIYRPTDSGWYWLDAGASGNAGKGTYTLSGSTLADDFGNNIHTNGVVLSGTPVQGLISFNGDSDWFKTGLTKGQMVVINAIGDVSDTAQLDPLLDPLIIIHDASGKEVFKADDFGGTLDARAYFTPSADGLYFIEVRSAFRYDTGAYQVSVDAAPADDFNNTVAQAVATPVKAGALVLGTPMNAVLEVPGDHDMFGLSLEAGRVYQLSTLGFASHNGTLADPYLRVFDAAGHLLDFANGGGMGTDAMLYFAPSLSATYYLEASANDDRAMGTYQVVAVQRDMPADDVPNDLSTGVVLNPDDSFAGQLLMHNDQDWFRITLSAQQNYVFRVRASESGYGSLLDPVLEIRSADGVLLQSVDNGVVSHEPATAFTPIASGSYYLVVRAANGQTDTGSYTLMTRAPDDHSDTLPRASVLARDVALAGNIGWSYGAFGVRAYDSIGIATDADEDWFAFSADADEVLSFVVTPSAGSTLSRSLVEVLDASGRMFAIGDGLETSNGSATATFKSGAAGTYYARVIDGAGATGSYSVQVSAGDASDEDASGAPSLGFATSGAVTKAEVVARLGLAGDTDQFSLDLQAGHQYRLETLAVRDGSHAPLPSASMALSFAPSGGTAQEVVVQQTVAEPSLFDTTSFTAESAGRLSVTVRAIDATQTGQYKLRVVDLGGSVLDDWPDTAESYGDSEHGVLASNDAAGGRIDSASDADLFAINLTEGNLYDFSVKAFGDGLGTLAQPTLRLLDANGALVTVATFDASSGRADLAVSVFDSARYYLAVGGADVPGNLGTYQLETRWRDGSTAGVDDLSADTRSGLSVKPGAPAAGRINYAGDQDWISATLVAGKVYVADLLAYGAGSSGTVGGTLKDGTLRLLDASGEALMQDDNSGAGLDARLLLTPASDGTYFFDVGAKGGELGTYTLRLRELYGGVADPLQSAQWYRPALGVDQLDGLVSGAGVTVGMVDDGIDTAHPDLQAQIDFAKAFDAATDTQDGKHKSVFDFHGTPVAGIIVGVQNNETGIVGIAPDAQIVSTRVKWTWEHITQALGLQHQFDVSNNSWGANEPFSDNFNSTALTFAYEALRKGVEDGRQGLGTVFVFSGGNSGAYGDNTNYHNFQNAREVITVAAAERDGSVAGFSTPGASILVGTYGVDLLTTDRHEKGLGLNPGGNYTGFSGTSAAAPVVSAVVALMLEANPGLGYRDVQEILALSASHPESMSWKTNAASNWNLGGMRFNDQLGFGLVDAYAAVQLAATWTSVHSAINEAVSSARAYGLQVAIPDGEGAYSKTFHLDSSLAVEHVELGIDLRHTRLGDLIIELTSPSGTVTRLMDRPTVNSEMPFGLSGADSGVPTHLLWDFSSVQFWGEQADGDWKVSVRDVRAEETGRLSSLSLRVYGARANGNDTYVFTEEGFKSDATMVLQDETGIDTVNAAVLLHDVFIDLPHGRISAEGVTHPIASWTVIENAITGTGNDRLDGNDVGNSLQGRAGNDTLQGSLGDDTLIGGAGSDTAVYAGAMAEFGVSYNPNTRVLTVVDNLTTGGNEGTDLLSGIERLVFSDGDMSLGATVGNHAPLANRTLFEKTILVAKGMGISFDLPADAFSDPDAGSASGAGALEITASNAGGGELPSWLSFDPVTGTFSGVPPEGQQGLIKLTVEALDEFGVAVSGTLTFQLGDNQAPLLDAARELVVDEDAALLNLGISVPLDPEGTAVSVSITDIPVLGQVLRRDGTVLAIGAVLPAEELDELHYQSARDANGNGGNLRFTATDADGVTAETSIHIFVTAVNDAPRFGDDSKLTINYPTQRDVVLDVARPSDPESGITQVSVIELPAMGAVYLGTQALTIGQTLTTAQLTGLHFMLNENVNGPIGSLGIQAVDPQGLSSTWKLALQVQGEAYSTVGSAVADAMYGSIGEDTLYGMGGNDTLVGNAGKDRLLGGAGDDTVLGGSGADALDASSGNDYLDGGVGADTMAGGPGNDHYLVDDIADVVIEALSRGAGGTDLVQTGVSYSAPGNVENLLAQASLVIHLTGNELNNQLSGNELGNSLVGGAGADTLLGFAGSDTLDGGVGVDKMAGGSGDDLYRVDSRSDLVLEYASEGTDTVEAASTYTLTSNVENLTLLEGGDWAGGGNSLANLITGNNGNNLLSGGLGADTLTGGLGDDTYVLSDYLDTLIDAGGSDTIRTSLSMTLQAGFERAELIGLGDISALGNAADNTLIGNPGNNYMEGAGGVDTLSGGAGGDGFFIVYNGVDKSADTLTDFKSGEDLLMLDLASFGIDPVALGILSSGMAAPDTLVQGAGARALDPNDYFVFDTAQRILFIDPDGSGAQVALAGVRLMGSAAGTLSADDIYLTI